MVTNFEVRVLLALWDLGGVEVQKRDLTGRFSTRTKEANESCASLVKTGEIAANGKLLTLTDAGKALLGVSLANNEFEFEAQIGAKMANAVLKWWRSQPRDGAKVAGTVETIESYEAFKSVALETHDRLNRDFNLDNLVPIYRIRREIGDRVSRANFDLWLLEMQASDILQLQGGSLPDGDAAKLEDSITTELSGLRCYATLLEA